ncbi:MAG: flagellar motor protein MotA, partial [Alphaproteobacteria bacterium]|nr:flagellar motor protein MotA [Alphaproteobacteria bacterium]
QLVGVMENSQKASGIGSEASNALKNIEGHLAKMSADQSKGRDDAVQEIRSEIRLLARTIAALGEGN